MVDIERREIALLLITFVLSIPIVWGIHQIPFVQENMRKADERNRQIYLENSKKCKEEFEGVPTEHGCYIKTLQKVQYLPYAAF